MVLSHKYSCGPSLNLFRNICIHSVLECNHYKALGLNPWATHAEIKTAYYELSKIHHPDKNQGSEESAKMFRDITEAYEILGNEKSRKQYDREQFLNKGMDNFGSTSQRASERMVYDNDMERVIYERIIKQKAYRRYGNTPYYDIDAWFRAHYGNTYKFSKYDYESAKTHKFYYGYNDKQTASFAKFKMRFIVSLYATTALFFLIWIQNLIQRKK